MPQYGASLKIVIYNRNILMIEATGFDNFEDIVVNHDYHFFVCAPYK